ncbi:hypothetical protein [Maridesulfovibrio hydrothermalis]|uniref:Uncharacterized protein n=1 Tax=Maridesulfovibrio hydrothermalis AM13 = DSM 14728 TaxID=1121451 RepID=L0R6P2_9BACT|nr:hypothetical protein [Maridesulfovibrio hydrothermalis]CCO22378.1 conserved membrane protein of unknown function [Maridesulfovibrio hydrothermalis AM13 = DSM 14728]
MDPSLLIPDVIGISVHPVWPVTLSIITFSIHLLLMNAVFGGTAIVVCHSFSGGTEISRSVSKKLPTILALAINAGVPPLLFLQAVYGQFSYVSSILMAVFWMVVIVALITGYYGLYFHNYRYDKISPTTRKFVMLTVFCLIFYIGFMLSNKMTLMLRPEVWVQYFSDPDGYILNLSDPVLIPRFLHFVVSALAVGGLFVALIGWKKGDQYFVDTGMKWFARSTIVNVPIGFWFLAALPQKVMLIFMGQDMPATILLVTGLIVTFIMLHSGFTKNVVFATISTMFIVPVMAIMRHLVRQKYLEPFFNLDTAPVSGQWQPMALFVISLVVGIFCIVYMLRLMLKAERS